MTEDGLLLEDSNSMVMLVAFFIRLTSYSPWQWPALIIQTINDLSLWSHPIDKDKKGKVDTKMKSDTESKTTYQ